METPIKMDDLGGFHPLLLVQHPNLEKPEITQLDETGAIGISNNRKQFGATFPL